MIFVIYFFYFLVLGSLALYSYVLIDPNMTFFNHPAWSWFLERVLQIGYYQRQLSWQIYFVFICLLFIFHFIFTSKDKKFNPLVIGLIISIVVVLAYPFLSHDLFNYMFDAKILTFYHKNPYFFRAIDFSDDPWLRFMQWLHRTYPYGPSFLPITLVPSFLSFGKFLSNFVLFKLLNVFFYGLAIFFLNKINKKQAIFFATNPLIIVEGIINGHNDLITVALAICGVYWLVKKKNIAGRLFLLLSMGIKYISLPAMFLTLKKGREKINLALFFIQILILSYLFVTSEMQPWYFLNVFIFVPFFGGIIKRMNLFFFGLLISYYPFIRFGEWSSWNKFQVRHLIIVAFAAVNLSLFVLIPKWRKIQD